MINYFFNYPPRNTEGSVKVIQGTEIQNIVFPLYPLTYRLADARRAVYYHIDDKNLPKTVKAKVGSLYNVNEKGIICDIKTGDRIIRNKKVVGTPREEPINHQAFWSSGPGQQFKRQKLREQLGQYFTPRMIRYLPEKILIPEGYFLHLEYIFYYPFDLCVTQHVPDIDNHAMIYMKTFKDMLQVLNLIEGDDFRYVRGDYARYQEVKRQEDRRLEIRFHLCQNNHQAVPKIFAKRKY